MGIISDIGQIMISVIKSISVADGIDMLILSYLLYKGIKLIRETRAEQLIKGIVLLSVAYFVVSQLKLKTMGFLLDNFFQWGILAVIIMFQPELRRALEKMGRAKVSSFGVFSIGADMETDLFNKWTVAIDAIVEASSELSATTTGALIVIERQTRLGEQIDTGTIINATPSAAIFGNIFFPNTPLHDGAVIIRDGIILAAGCFLPKPQKEEFINKQLGSRHRAAIGMSENSDAIIIVVSEETGTISIAEDGRLTRGFNKESLKKFLKAKIIPEKQPPEKERKKKKLFPGKVKSK
ncbi:MAG: diadenylate cyclase CdaA [Oscillospiraceae bacterium]|jgi:diadenylate cyclase